MNSGGSWTRSAIGTNPGTGLGVALAVSNAGGVILGVNSTSDDGGWYWTQASGVQPLSNGSFSDTTGYALSDDGSRAVGYGSASGNFTAVIWDGVASTPRTIEQMLLDDYGFDIGQDTLHFATDISADGRTIVGKGVDFGQPGSRVWYLQLPPPPPVVPTLPLWAVGALGLALLAAASRLLRNALRSDARAGA